MGTKRGFMKIGWIGFHQEGVPALRGVLEGGYHLEACPHSEA